MLKQIMLTKTTLAGQKTFKQKATVHNYKNGNPNKHERWK